MYQHYQNHNCLLTQYGLLQAEQYTYYPNIASQVNMGASCEYYMFDHMVNCVISIPCQCIKFSIILLFPLIGALRF